MNSAFILFIFTLKCFKETEPGGSGGGRGDSNRSAVPVRRVCHSLSVGAEAERRPGLRSGGNLQDFSPPSFLLRLMATTLPDNVRPCVRSAEEVRPAEVEVGGSGDLDVRMMMMEIRVVSTNSSSGFIWVCCPVGPDLLLQIIPN